jgi:hypothetical protein
MELIARTALPALQKTSGAGKDGLPHSDSITAVDLPAFRPA